MKRGDVSLQRSISRGLKMAFINGSFTELPKGLKRSQAPSALATEELRGLRRDAEEQVSRYEILTQLQIANLNQVRTLVTYDAETLPLNRVRNRDCWTKIASRSGKPSRASERGEGPFF